MRRSVIVIAAIVALTAGSSWPGELQGVCPTSIERATRDHRCCHAGTPSPASACAMHEQAQRPDTMERPCCCDHEPAPSPVPAQAPGSTQSDLAATAASPAAAAVSAALMTARPSSPAQSVASDRSPPVFLLTCAFLI